MSHKHQRLLEAVYHEPVSANIHWREVESLLHHLGATLEPLSGARLHVLLNSREGVLHRPHHSNVCTKQEIRHLRGFLASAGVTLARYEASQHPDR
jgi:hypothetical protein